MTSRADEPLVHGYPRPDGGFGLRNHILVIALLDLANDVALRICAACDDAIAILTPTGGLSFGAELRLTARLRLALARNPNVGAVVLVGPTPPPVDEWRALIGRGRFVETVSLLSERDMRGAVDCGVRAVRRLSRELSGQTRHARPLGALCVGLRSSSSSLESARLVNPLVGSVVDRIVDAGGTVAFGEAADLAGVAGELVARAASDPIGAEIRRVVDAARERLAMLGDEAPDPTPTNRQGGIESIALKGQGALRRLGTKPIGDVFAFGDRSRAGGLALMDGPGSAALCLTGLAAAGCALVLYTVGATSCTAALPMAPVVKVGPPTLAGSRDLDLCATEDGAGTQDLLDLVCEVASGRPAAGEAEAARQLMLPGWLPPL